MTKGGGGFLTPKAISNRIKAKGLQKLRWYCQMCQKQCRDENGMKNHMSSEGHLRMMKVFAEAPGRAISEFSEAFLSGYLKTLSHRHGTKRVSANKVYQEYIGDKDHIHMNATAWSSLAGLCKFLGKEGKCVVEETDKGWFVQWIDRDPKTLERQAQLEHRQKSELDDEERTRQLIEAQIAAGGCFSTAEEEDVEVSHELERSDDTPKIGLTLQPKSSSLPAVSSSSSSLPEDFFSTTSSETLSVKSSAQGTTSIQRLMNEEEARKLREIQAMDKKNRTDNWLCEGITVKIANKTVGGGKYYKLKGVVVRVVDEFVAEVKVEGMAVLRLDQDDLETVIPKVGSRLMIVNGRARGCIASLLAINEDKFNCTVRVEQGILAGRDLEGVEYEDVCKLA